MQEIYFDICAAIIITALIFSLIFRKMVNGRTNKLFLYTCICVLISSISDILADADFLKEAVTLRIIANYTYFIFRNATIVFFDLFIFSITGYWHKFISNTLLKGYLLLFGIIFISMLFYNISSDVIFYIDESLEYQRGSYLWILYLLGFTNMVYGALFVLKNRKMLHKDQFYTIILSYVANLIAVGVQATDKSIVVELFATTIALNLMPVTVNRPEMRDPILGVKNYNAYIIEMHKSFESQNGLYMLFVELRNRDSLRLNLGQEKYDKLLKQLLESLSKLCDKERAYMTPYKIDESIFSLVFESDCYYGKILDIGNVIKEKLSKGITFMDMNVLFDYRICFINTEKDIDNIDDIIAYKKNIANFLPNSKDVILLARELTTQEFMINNKLDEMIDKALKNKKFEMYYQPIYSVKEKRFVAAEALIRLYDERFGMIDADTLIRKSEQSGSIHQVGEYVLNEVIKYAGSKEFLDLGLNGISINLSMVQLLELDLVDRILELIDKYNVDKSTLIFEITETSEELDKTIDENIEKLVSNGLRLALDDYGTGYSNIRRIGHMPLDVIKIDELFVREDYNKSMNIVLDNTSRMLREMDKILVIEGIETKEQLDHFTALGCEYIQGFYFADAMPPNRFENFINDNKKNVAI